ncbi:MAG: hypothetical protein K2L12_03935 [Clostridia bacterium]|nr:hypothetical protein [Clostridia bacterium]
MEEQRENYKIRLGKYTKAEIIDGIIQTVSGADIQLILSGAERKRSENEYEQTKKLSDAHTKAFDEYIGYVKEISTQYGDGEHCTVNDIPSEKRDEVLNKMVELQEQVKALSKKLYARDCKRWKT